MDERGIAAAARDLILRELGAADEAIGMALPERDVAGGIFVEERVVEQESRLADRRGVRHERDLTDPAGALVGVEQLVEHVRPLGGMGLDDTPHLELNRDIGDERAVVAERLGGTDGTGNAVLVRSGRDFLGGDVRVAGYAVLGL